MSKVLRRKMDTPWMKAPFTVAGRTDLMWSMNASTFARRSSSLNDSFPTAA